jgi:hypothetical protein
MIKKTCPRAAISVGKVVINNAFTINTAFNAWSLTDVITKNV